jgi:hypothetical protein
LTDQAALTVVYLPIDALIPYARNSRTHSDAQVAQIAGSIREFSFTNPVLVDGDGGIIAGHGRVLAARQLGMQAVPCIRLGHLTPTQRKALIIADNKLALNAGWDEDRLKLEMEELQADGFSLELTGFSGAELADLFDAGGAARGAAYTRKIEAPIYHPTGENPPVAALIDGTKTRELKAEIRAADIPEEIAAFLETAADRHTVFNFARIAEFYAHAEPEVQRLMEASALVIIDFDQAIEGGFVKLTKRLGDLVGEQQADAA